MKRAFRAIIHGIVQGVAFRYYTQQQADGRNLTGFVRNLPNGTVEVFAQGDEQDLNALESWLDKGPPSARVEHVDLTWCEPEEKYSSFNISF